MAERNNGTSGHILGTSANLLGFCLFVLTSLHVANKSETHTLDQLTSLVALMLALSCVFSFASLRTDIPRRGVRLEKIANYLFIASLLGIVVIIGMISLNFAR